METVLLGHKRLMEVQRLKDELYMKEDFTEEDGIKAGELETEFAELGGWEAESEDKNPSFWNWNSRFSFQHKNERYRPKTKS